MLYIIHYRRAVGCDIVLTAFLHQFPVFLCNKVSSEGYLVDICKSQGSYHPHQYPVIFRFLELGRETWCDHCSRRFLPVKKLQHPVGSIKEDLGALAADLCTVSACDASLIYYFCLSSHNPDSFGRTLPHAGVAGPAKFLYGVNEHNYGVLIK